MTSDHTQERTYITAGGMAKVEEQLARLKGSRRLEMIERLQDALAGGDCLENTEYIAAQEDLAVLDGRIQALENILRSAELIVPDTIDGVVRLGRTVVVQEHGGEPETYKLVGPAEANPCEGMISVHCPLGMAILNHVAGDEVPVLTPRGPTCFRIISVC